MFVKKWWYQPSKVVMSFALTLITQNIPSSGTIFLKKA